MDLRHLLGEPAGAAAAPVVVVGIMAHLTLEKALSVDHLEVVHLLSITTMKARNIQILFLEIQEINSGIRMDLEMAAAVVLVVVLEIDPPSTAAAEEEEVKGKDILLLLLEAVLV